MKFKWARFVMRQPTKYIQQQSSLFVVSKVNENFLKHRKSEPLWHWRTFQYVRPRCFSNFQLRQLLVENLLLKADLSESESLFKAKKIKKDQQVYVSTVFIQTSSLKLSMRAVIATKIPSDKFFFKKLQILIQISKTGKLNNEIWHKTTWISSPKLYWFVLNFESA